MYSRNAMYFHLRLRDPRSFRQDSFRTVPVHHTNYRGKWRRNGVLAIVGRNAYTGQGEVQALRVPKSFREEYLR